MKKIYSLIAIVTASFAVNAQVVISQVYGGGGNSGAVYSHDFVELFNTGAQPVTLTGHSLQYGAATGNFSAGNTQTLPSITIPAGGYYLIQQALGNNTSLPALPTPDLIPTAANNGTILALGGTNGKIALVNGVTPITGSTDATVVDFVGFGTANDHEGTAATPALGNDKAAFRNSDGCSDTNDNATDFTAATPAPRNSQTPVNICSGSTKQDNINGLNVFPNPANEVLFITSDANLDKNVQMFDMTGKKVLEVTTTSEINVANLKAGIYVAKITEAGKTATRKIVVR